ncbi:MAG: DUF3349 domain-containing protein [Dermatophilaceae bacterium]
MAASVPRHIIAWLKGGYPHGVPESDYVALLGILHRQLTDVEVREIAGSLAQGAEPGAPITEESIRSMIDRRIHEQADDASITRVSTRLKAGGWSLADS